MTDSVVQYCSDCLFLLLWCRDLFWLLP